jgi:hypothetical protein
MYDKFKALEKLLRIAMGLLLPTGSFSFFDVSTSIRKGH